MSGFIDWANLKNPVLEYPQWSIKDACCTWRDGTFTLFFSAFDQERSHVAAVNTRDFREYSDLLFFFDGHIGMCSPNIVHVGDAYYVSFNSWGDDPDNPNRLFSMQSGDLLHWSERRSLAANLTHGIGAIDAALAFSGNAWILFYKNLESKRPVVDTAPSLDGPWTLIGDGKPSLLMADGQENGLIHENFQIIELDGRWRLLSTDYSPHHPYLYTLNGTGGQPENWLRWESGYRLETTVELFNTIDQDNAAALCDWREHDGYYYLIYAGKTEHRKGEFCGTASHRPWPRGWNKLALSRSRDLLHWYPAGVMD
jgi:hypothetical protein